VKRNNKKMSSQSYNIVALPQQHFIGVKRLNTERPRIGETIREAYHTLQQFLKNNDAIDIITNKQDIIRYTSSGTENQVNLFAGVFIDLSQVERVKLLLDNSSIEVDSLSDGKYAHSVHIGSYDGLPNAWNKLFENLHRDGHESINIPYSCYEQYITRCDEESDSSKWITDIYVQIK
jgi:effector-binding domain-containing protein